MVNLRSSSRGPCDVPATAHAAVCNPDISYDSEDPWWVEGDSLRAEQQRARIKRIDAINARINAQSCSAH